MVIRQERREDYEAVYRVIQEAFTPVEESGGTERDLVAALRKSPDFLPALSLVAEEDGRIVGHILFSRAYVGTCPVLALAPLSVLPACQRRGVGLALMERGHALARALGYGYSVVLGHPGYYPRAGYVPAERYGIRPPFPVEVEGAFQALRLDPRAELLDGTIRYDPAFGI